MTSMGSSDNHWITVPSQTIVWRVYNFEYISEMVKDNYLYTSLQYIQTEF